MTRCRAHATTGQIVRHARNLKILAAMESDDLTGAEIGRQFGLSPARVSQIRREILSRSSSGKNLTQEKILPLGRPQLASMPA